MPYSRGIEITIFGTCKRVSRTCVIKRYTLISFIASVTTIAFPITDSIPCDTLLTSVPTSYKLFGAWVFGTIEFVTVVVAFEENKIIAYFVCINALGSVVAFESSPKRALFAGLGRLVVAERGVAANTIHHAIAQLLG